MEERVVFNDVLDQVALESSRAARGRLETAAKRKTIVVIFEQNRLEFGIEISDPITLDRKVWRIQRQPIRDRHPNVNGPQPVGECLFEPDRVLIQINGPTVWPNGEWTGIGNQRVGEQLVVKDDSVLGNRSVIRGHLQPAGSATERKISGCESLVKGLQHELAPKVYPRNICG